MAERPNELKKLAAIAADLDLSAELRTKAVQLIGSIGTHDALVALLDIVANQGLVSEERDFALKQARELIKSGH